ncbi:LysE family translocator [Campylobacter sp. RM13119]|uniref:LysE family translocator n=1 Tax=Campylobacter californiensis TaxID=1032243 RepID=UPI0014726E55|nr:LysE family translocator [Campylobacter sp. RM13119]MBE3606920.1 LysE family translocator [Campylobacter sp. RM13119]
MNYLLFVVTFFPISFMPGINMTLALSVGMSIGYMRAIPMILGQLVGVVLVSFLCILGAATLLMRYEFVFEMIRICGAIYIIYLVIMLFFSCGKLSVKSYKGDMNKRTLFTQGLIISFSNPKAWIFFAAILPPFLDKQDPFGTGMYLLVFLLALVEFTCLSIYSLGGAALKRILFNHLRMLEIFTASLMCFIGIWMILS